MPLKIAILGAGSLFWSSTIIHDLCSTPEMKGSTISLVDIDEDRLNSVYRLAKRYSAEVKFEMTVLKTKNRREAIKDSDFVINTAMAGGHQYYEKMRAISEKNGYFRGINSVEGNMVSDYHTIWGYYQLKLARDIAEDVEELSPESWLLQLSNPVFELTTLIGRLFKIKLVGVCHGHMDYRDIVGSVGLREREMEVESIGLNHTIWMTKFKNRQEDAYPILREWVDKEYHSFYKGWLTTTRSNPLSVQMSPAMVDMYNEFGLVPIGDTVRSGSWKYHRNHRTKVRWYGALGGFDSAIGWKFYLDSEKRNMSAINNALENTKESLSYLFPSGISDEPVVPILNALANDVRGNYQVNVINNGIFDGIRDNVAVETPSVIDGKGIHRIGGRKLPKKVMNFSILPRIQRMEWALEAFTDGGKEMLLEWLMADPRTRTNKQAERVVQELLGLKENKEMAKHFN